MIEKNEKIIHPVDFGLNTEEMARAGVHFGHRVSKLHPKMRPYIQGIKNTVHIIDLEQTKKKLEEALNFIQQAIAQEKIILVVGTKVQARNIVSQVANNLGLAYVVERWLGGTLTNFSEMKRRIDYFQDLKQKRAAGEFEKYTKKEIMKIDRELQELEKKFGGIVSLKRLPDILFVLDMRKDKLACLEARKKGVTVIGVADTNTNPDLADLVIPANDDAISSLEYIMNKFAIAVRAGQTMAREKSENKENKDNDDNEDNSLVK